MESLSASLDKLFHGKEEDFSEFLKILSNYQLGRNDEYYFNQTILPKLQFLFDNQILGRDYVYLALISRENYEILKRILYNDYTHFQFNLTDPLSIYNYCIYKQEHWFYDILKNYQNYKEFFEASIKNKFYLTKLIEITNTTTKQIDITQIYSIISDIEIEDLGKFWRFYINQILRIIEIVEFYKNIDDNCNEYELFQYSSENTLLTTLSNYMNLNNRTWHDIILDKIHEFEQKYREYGEYEIYQAFIILSTLINLFVTKNNELKRKYHINKLIDDVNDKLQNLKECSLQIELLENIFSLLFYRNNDDFVCNDEKSVRIILYLLKTTIDELLLKQSYEKSSTEYQRLIQLDLLIKDAFWRLDLITNLHHNDRLIHYMLAPPLSLIHLCLKRDDFERVQQVITIFNLNDSDVAREIDNIRKLERFRKDTMSLDWKSIKKQMTTLQLNEYDLFDFAITTINREMCNNLLELSRKKIGTDQIFYRKMFELSQIIGDEFENLAMVLNAPQLPLDLDQCRRKQQFYETLDELYRQCQNQTNQTKGGLNKNHSLHGVFLKINDLCCVYLKNSQQESVQYLSKVYNYLQAFSKVLYIEEDSSEIISNGFNVSYFELLKFNRSELIGKLLFEHCLDPSEFERYFQKLRLDFLYHIVGNCFPTINLHVNENVSIEELYHDNMLYVPSKNIIIYIQKRNWLLAFILNQIYKIDQFEQMEISQKRLQIFFNYVKLSKIKQLKVMFDNNEIIAALQNCTNVQKVKIYIHEQVVNQDLASINSLQLNNNNTDDNINDSCASDNTIDNNNGFETGEEILEDSRITNWRGLYDFIESIPEQQLRKQNEFIKLRNNILINLIQDNLDIDSYKYLYLIDNRDLRVDIIFTNFKRWPGPVALNIIKSELTQFNCCNDKKLQHLRNWLQKIELGEKLRPILNLKSWYRCHDFCKKQQNSAMSAILLAKNIDILLKFIDLYKPTDEILYNIELNYLTKMIESNTSLIQIRQLFDSLPYLYTLEICHNLLTILHKVELLQFIADYLSNNEPDNLLLKNIQISLKILQVFTQQEQEQLYCLINEPLHILEVLLMNTKLDKFASVLQLLDFNDTVISVEKIDSLLRHYAEKSLDFRVATTLQRNQIIKQTELKLLQSMDSITQTLQFDKKQFQIPEYVPRKDQWISNNVVLECMCCHLVTFSMFNRRHHCRRCGRVVCYNCSMKRMLVESYGDILVRVCNDCYEQTAKNDSTIARMTITQEFWLLNDNPEHNKIVREEFSYEHAPSVSLCLSILKYHSKSPECARFLLEQCELMLKLLQPNQEPTQEIDYLLVIKMLKSLAMAAKLLSADYNTISTADRVLSQTELLGLLADRGCLNLIPIINASTTQPTIYVDSSVLRRLRDKLIQLEQWDLALEITTKAGLDNLCIFAGWGKSCLKVGRFLVAREKFQRCFNTTSNTSQTDSLSTLSRFSSDLSLVPSSSTTATLTNRSRISSKLSIISDNKPMKDPLLLQEIIKILETINERYHPKIVDDFHMCTTPRNDPPINILNRIKRLNDVSMGKYNNVLPQKTPTKCTDLDPIIYEECIYYLEKYGSNLSLLEFYIRHGNIDVALNYMLDNGLCSDVFVEIYMKCLRDGIITELQREMSIIDSSLETWTDYLKQICRHLEKQQLFNSLYQLQLFMSDYVRAAMTCIRFYQDNAKTFIELLSNIGNLIKAEEHLKQILEQEQWVEVTSISTTSLQSATLENFEEKIISTSSLVMKIDHKDINKHIKTIKKQIEIVNFFAGLENDGVNVVAALRDLLKSNDYKIGNIPSLFGASFEKTILAVTAIICDKKIENGFKIASDIMKEFKLRPIKIYCLASKQLAKNQNFNGITLLVNCIKSTNHNDPAIDDMLDEVLILTVGTLVKANITGTRVEDLIKLIKDRAIKISAYIEAKQLKTAYFLAVKYKRTADIRRIQHEAELLNLPNIKTLCQRYLQNCSQSSSHSRDQDSN